MVDKIINPPSQKDLIDKVNELVDNKQDTLVSGTNIKTINNTSILGSGNIGTVTSVNNVSPVNGNVTLSIPAAQVNSDWNATSGVARILNKPTIPTVNNPTITFTQGGTTKGTITLNQSSNQTVALDAGARNIGQIIQSTIPLTDAGLHLLDGSVISGDGVYGDFYNYIAGIVSTYPNLFITEAAWQAEVASHGVCGKFVFYEPNRTVRLPKITGITQSSESINALGDYIAAGLPNITGQVRYGNGGDIGVNAQYVSGAFYADTGTNLTSASSGGQTNDHPLLFNASRSSSIYGRSNTVQPQSIKVLYYIVIATSTKTDIQVDIDKIATDLNGKADTDLSNINASGKSFASGLAMPSSRYIDLTLGASGATYTAPANGYFCFNGKDSSNTGTAEVVIRNQTRYFGVAGSNTNSTRTPAWSGYILPAKKGDTVYLYYLGTLALDSTNWSWRFYYAKGEA